MDITPVIPKGQNILKGYGNMGFSVNDQKYQGSIVITPSSVEAWPATSAEQIVAEDLHALMGNKIEILLIGAGEAHHPIPPKIHRYFTSLNIGAEFMTTGAACRTYNVLLAEGRNVAAALIAV